MEILVYVIAFFVISSVVVVVVMLLDGRSDRERRMTQLDHSDLARIRREILEGRGKG